MTNLLQTHRETLFRLCQEYDVLRLEVFGSTVRGDFNQDSDVDFIVQFAKRKGRDRFYQYFEFKEALEHLLEREVDLLEAGAIDNPYFLKAIEGERELMYAA